MSIQSICPELLQIAIQPSHRFRGFSEAVIRQEIVIRRLQRPFDKPLPGFYTHYDDLRKVPIMANDPISLAERDIGPLIHPFTNLALHRDRGPFRPDQGVGVCCALRAQEHGLIELALGDTIAVCPPLIIE